MSRPASMLWLPRAAAFSARQESSPKLTPDLAAFHASQYSGIVNDKAVGVEAAPSGRGVVVSTKKTKAPSNKVAGTRNNYTISKGGSRRAAGVTANIVAKNGYRPDLLKVSWSPL